MLQSIPAWNARSVTPKTPTRPSSAGSRAVRIPDHPFAYISDWGLIILAPVLGLFYVLQSGMDRRLVVPGWVVGSELVYSVVLVNVLLDRNPLALGVLWLIGVGLVALAL